MIYTIINEHDNKTRTELLQLQLAHWKHIGHELKMFVVNPYILYILLCCI